MAATFTIENEDSLWELLDIFTTGSTETPSKLQFRGWNPALLYFPDNPIGHTLRPNVAAALVDYHASLSRAYALLKYGHANRQLLRKEDREALEFDFQVVDGSTGIKLIDDAIENLTQEMVGKMSGTQVTVTIALFLILYFGQSTYLGWVAEEYNARIEIQAGAERIRLSEQETERMKILSQALLDTPIGTTLEEVSNDGKKALLKPASKEPQTEIRGTAITQEQAKLILTSPRESGVGVRMDGMFKVVDINTELDAGFRIRLENQETKQEFWANAEYSQLPQKDIDLIFAVAHEKGTLFANINAFMIRERIESATIVRASESKE